MLEIVDFGEPIMGLWAGPWMLDPSEEWHCFDQLPYIDPAIVWC